MAEEEYHHYGGEKVSHGVVSSVVSRNCVVEDCSSRIAYFNFFLYFFSLPVDFSVYEIVEDGEKNNRDETHDQEVSNLESVHNLYHL